MPLVELADTELWYSETGQDAGQGADTLVFGHGYLGSSAVWSAAVRALADRYRCISLDARGVGRSGRPLDGYSIDQWASDIIAVADAIGLSTFTYIGHSMGGLTGYHLALTQPERLSRLVLVCPAPAGPPRAGKAAFARFRQAWIDKDVPAMSSLLAATSVYLPGGATERAVVAVNAAPGHVDDLLDASAEINLRPQLGTLEVPTLVVVGAADPALASGLTDYALLPNATLHVLSGVGHVPQLEATDVFADVLRRFLTDGVITFSTLLDRMTSSTG